MFVGLMYVPLIHFDGNGDGKSAWVSHAQGGNLAERAMVNFKSPAVLKS